MFTIASEETYPDGKMIFQEGSSGDWVYVILSGSVEISSFSLKDRSPVIDCSGLGAAGDVLVVAWEASA